MQTECGNGERAEKEKGELMSIRLMSNVWAHSKAKGSQLLLLLSIADHADDDGSGAYPSIGHLAGKVRMSERNVQRIIKQLVNKGELAVILNGGPRGCNLYRVTICRGEIQGTEGVTPVSPKPSKNYQTITIKENRSPVKVVVDGETLRAMFSEGDLVELRARFPGLDIDWESDKCVVWWHDQKRTMKRPRSAFLNWLDKAKPNANLVNGKDPFAEGGEYEGMQKARIMRR